MPSKKAPTKGTDRIYPPSHLRELADTVVLMEAWCKATRQLLASQVAAGKEVPGVTMEPSYSPRAWDDSGLDEDEMMKLLQRKFKALGRPSTLDDVAPRKVLSPAQAEKLLGKPAFAETLAEYAVQLPTGNYTLRIGSVTKARKSLLTKSS